MYFLFHEKIYPMEFVLAAMAATTGIPKVSCSVTNSSL